VRTRWKRSFRALGEIDNTKSSAELTALMDEEQGKRKASGKTSDAPPGSVGRSPFRKKPKPKEGDGEGEGDDEDEDEDELGPMTGRGRAGRHEGAQRGVRQNGGSGAGSRMVKSSQDTRRDGGGGTKAGSRDGGGGARAGSRSRAERDAIQAKRKEGR
jgi:hypothetical protein